VDVQNRVATAQGRLPQEIKNTGHHHQGESQLLLRPGSIRLTTAFRTSTSLITWMFTSGALSGFREWARSCLRRAQYAMRIWLDPTKLAARH